jgi:hypothetical protein
MRETHCLWPLIPADKIKRDRSWEVRKSSSGDDSHPVDSTSVITHLL